MRIIVFFDLPVTTSQGRREYSKFHRYLIKKGFAMMQESIYCKMALNGTVLKSIMEDIRKNRPSDGTVQILSITEKQFSKIEYIIGDYSGDIISSDDRLVEL